MDMQDKSLGDRTLNSGILSASVANLSLTGLQDNVIIHLRNTQPVAVSLFFFKIQNSCRHKETYASLNNNNNKKDHILQLQMLFFVSFLLNNRVILWLHVFSGTSH